MMIINDKGHINLQSNVPFEELPKWFQDADTTNARVTYQNEKLTWYYGVWVDGMWKDGVWEGGFWKDGEWRDGIWKSGTWYTGVWKGGKWYSGIWKEGFWYRGEWHSGDWEIGDWYNGVWYKGVWRDGVWHNGTWHNGIWYYGRWIKGIWLGGRKGQSLCKWEVNYDSIKDTVRIGCKEKTVKQWDRWFRTGGTYITKRNTEEFENIYKAYLIAKYSIKIENKDYDDYQ